MHLTAQTVPLFFALVASPALACPDPYPDPAAPPETGEINYGAGSSVFPHPFTMPVLGVGGWNLRDCGLEGEGLTGYSGNGLINARPALLVHWRGGHPELTVSVENEDDTFLLISDPEGRWLFNEDSQEHNPQVVIPDPPPGDYAIFIGTHGTLTFTRPGMLTISGQGQPQDAPAFSDEELIASAEQGAPPSMSGPAQIIVWEEGGMRVLREGTNGWWCVPDNPASPAPDPFCGDANALPWWTALMGGQEAPPEGEVGLLYAEQGVQIADNTDPFATEPSEGRDWITFPPHQATIGRSSDVAGMVATPTPDTSKPVAVWMDTPYVHQRMPLDW